MFTCLRSFIYFLISDHGVNVLFNTALTTSTLVVGYSTFLSPQLPPIGTPLSHLVS